MKPEVITGASGTCLEQVEQVEQGCPFKLDAEAEKAIRDGRKKIDILLKQGKFVLRHNGACQSAEPCIHSIDRFA